MSVGQALRVDGSRLRGLRPVTATIVLVLAAGALVVAAGCLLLPSYVETGPDQDLAFACGSALLPNVEPPQEPGITACAMETEGKRSDALPWAAVGSAAAVLGLVLLLQGRGRGRSDEPAS
ncbi:hypothetical protein GCM10009872_53990 [Actinopolymorpha rutila]